MIPHYLILSYPPRISPLKSGRQPLFRTPLFRQPLFQQPLFWQPLFRQYQCDAHWMSIYRTFVLSHLTCGCYIQSVWISGGARNFQLWLVHTSVEVIIQCGQGCHGRTRWSSMEYRRLLRLPADIVETSNISRTSVLSAKSQETSRSCTYGSASICPVTSRLLQHHTSRIARLNVRTVTKSTERYSQAGTWPQAARLSNVGISSAPLAASPAESWIQAMPADPPSRDRKVAGLSCVAPDNGEVVCSEKVLLLGLLLRHSNCYCFTEWCTIPAIYRHWLSLYVCGCVHVFTDWEQKFHVIFVTGNESYNTFSLPGAKVLESRSSCYC